MMDFFQGINYWFKGLQLLQTKGLKRYVIIPIAFNLLFFVALFYVLNHYLLSYTYYYVDQLPSWLSFLSWVFFIIFLVSFFVVFVLVFTVMLNVIAAPFNGLLAEKAQKILFHSSVPSQSVARMLVRTLKRQTQFLAYFLPRLLVMIILFFVPLVQFIYPLLWFAFSAWILSLQYQDVAMDNNLINFDAMRDKLQHNRLSTLGFGTMTNLASIIPFLNILVMPAAVIGGVIMFCEKNNYN